MSDQKIHRMYIQVQSFLVDQRAYYDSPSDNRLISIGISFSGNLGTVFLIYYSKNSPSTNVHGCAFVDEASTSPICKRITSPIPP